MVDLYNRNVFTQNAFALANGYETRDLRELSKNYLYEKRLTLKIVHNLLEKLENEEINLASFFDGRRDIDAYCNIIKKFSTKQSYSFWMEKIFPDFYAFANISDEYIRLSELKVLMDNEYSPDMKTRAENNQKILNLIRAVKQNKK